MKRMKSEPFGVKWNIKPIFTKLGRLFFKRKNLKYPLGIRFQRIDTNPSIIGFAKRAFIRWKFFSQKHLHFFYKVFRQLNIHKFLRHKIKNKKSGSANTKIAKGVSSVEFNNQNNNNNNNNNQNRNQNNSQNNNNNNNQNRNQNNSQNNNNNNNQNKNQNNNNNQNNNQNRSFNF